MALQDICGFRDTVMHHKQHIPAPLRMSLEDTASALHAARDQHHLGWRDSASSGRTGGIPLHFFIPTLPKLPNRHSALFSPSTGSSTAVRRPFPLSHGTTTLGFVYQGGVVAAADSRASAGGLVACPSVQKITPVHSHLVATSSGSAADCMQWERMLAREIRLYQLRHGRRLSVSGTAKLLSYMLHPFKGTDVCVALTLCGWDKEEYTTNVVDRAMGSKVSVSDTTTVDLKQTGTSCGDGSSAAVGDKASVVRDTSLTGGPKLIFVCSDGTRLQGDLFSVGSGSPYAYGILDGGLRWSLSKEEAVALAREAVFRATHRDAYSGNNVDLYHITAQGWSRREREDLREEYYRERERIVKSVKFQV